MALVTFPTLTDVSVKWRLEVQQQMNRSSFTGKRKIIGMPGQDRWFAKVVVMPMARESQAREFRAFMAALRGQENTFRLPALPTQQRTAANPTVTTAVAGNRQVIVSSNSGLVVGMKATVQQINGHYRLVTIVGIAGTTIAIEPALSANPTLAAQFIVNAPFGLMSLDAAGFEEDDTNGIVTIGFGAEENP